MSEHKDKKIARLEAENERLKEQVLEEEQNFNRIVGRREDQKRERAKALELLEEVNREVKPIFDIYDNDYEPHEMPAHYPSPDGAADTFRKVNATITKLKGEG